ncbi:MAG: nuclear transport factor 2 family protein [Acidovorax sp.]|nr:nuclear transport factor 2 family protein [Acidovorax sp.]
MPHAKLRAAAVVGGSADDTEAAFYEALQKGDIEQLMACWAEEDDIVCVHPGGPRLLGAGAIRAAFEAMFAHGTLRARPAQVHRVQALASAVHSVVEHVEVMLPDGLHEALVQATNVYHKTPQGWRMVAHHASPGTVGEAQPAPDQVRPVLH